MGFGSNIAYLMSVSINLVQTANFGFGERDSAYMDFLHSMGPYLDKMNRMGIIAMVMSPNSMDAH